MPYRSFADGKLYWGDGRLIEEKSAMPTLMVQGLTPHSTVSMNREQIETLLCQAMQAAITHAKDDGNIRLVIEDSFEYTLIFEAQKTLGKGHFS